MKDITIKVVLEEIVWARRKNSGVLIIDDEAMLDNIEKALEKQITKEVIPYNSAKNHSFIECVACNGHIEKYYKYCTECGQKLH